MSATRHPATATDARPTPSAEPTVDAVRVWATIGAATLVFIAWILIRWVTGPNFARVHNGVSDPPGWMSVTLVVWQVISIPLALGALWVFVARPWRRDRTLGIDGLLALAFATLWFQDPLSNIGGVWTVYNTQLVNFGSWTADVPGWTSFAKPGAMLSSPILFLPAAYVYTMLAAAALGCSLMRRIRRRWPRLGVLWMIALCFGCMCVLDVVFEGIIWMPFGVFEFPGGHWAIFPDRYFKYPLNEMFTVGAVFTGFACLRYFLDDRGHSRVERGIDRIRYGPRRTVALRALAVTGAVHLVFFGFYTVPNTVIGLNSGPWPADLQKRSYFLNNLCGEGTDRFCPGPGVPNLRGGSAYPNVSGTVTPSRAGRPRVVPFDRDAPGGPQ